MRIELEGKEEKIKFAVILILVASDCFTVVYSHMVLNIDIVFTHFFYISIVLAAIWWKRKGMIVAIFLSVLLISSHIYFGLDAPLANEFVRSFMFIIVAFVVATLSDWIAKANVAVAAEKERLAVTLRSIGDGVISTDTEGRVTSMNEVAEQLTGWTHTESFGRPVGEVFNIIKEKTREKSENPVENVLKSGKIVELADHTVLISMDGTERRIGDSGAPIIDPEGKTIGVVLVFRDITVENRMQEEMAKTGRLESVGLLAGGIAHDFNNILTAVEGNIAMAKLHSGSESGILEYLGNAEKATNRAKNLTERLLTFAEGGDPVRKPTNLRKMLTETIGFALSGSKVTNSFSTGENLWSAEVDEGQISQAIANIVTNAKEAMPEGGTIEVKTENEVVDDGGHPGRLAGKYIKIEIEDSGVGISEESIRKVFEPFFTTKPNCKGLGLAVAYSIVEKHDGWIEVDSEVGKGSTFRIFLPAVEAVAEETRHAEAECAAGTGRVLWMDDEETIREVGGAMLDHLGYAAEFAEHGEKAVEMYAAAMRTNRPYDVVILDLTIPGGMGGKDTIRTLLEIDAGVKAVVCSGYSNDPVMANHKEHGFEGVLPKPFKMAELGDVLTRILNSGNGTTHPSHGDETSARSRSEECISEALKHASGS